MTPGGLDAYDVRMLAVIERCGFAVQYVGADSGFPPFAYTVNLHAVHGFELVLTGLAPATAQGLLNGAARALMDVAPPADGQELAGLLADGYRVRLVEEDAARAAPRMAMVGRLFPGEPRRVWRVQWPDRDCRWPGDPAFALPDLQPPL